MEDGKRKICRVRIPYRRDDDPVLPDDLVTAIRARRAGGNLLNLDRMLLNSPAFARGWNAMFATIRGCLSLAPRMRELVIVAVGVLNDAEYECAQHESEFLAAGGTQEQLNELIDVSAACENPILFDEAERAALSLALEMTRSVNVSEGTIGRLRTVMPDQQVVELVGTVAAYNMVSRFLVALGIELE